jgi:hypothetical protein
LLAGYQSTSPWSAAGPSRPTGSPAQPSRFEVDLPFAFWLEDVSTWRAEVDGELAERAGEEATFVARFTVATGSMSGTGIVAD